MQKWLWMFGICVSVGLIGRSQLALDGLIVEPGQDEEDTPQIDAPTHVDHGQPALSQVEQMEFLNGNKLMGKLKGITSEDGLVWSHPDAKAPLSFGLDNLKTVELEGPFPRESGKSPFTVQLTNGDRHMGDIVSMTSEELVIDTPYAGKVTVQVSMVERIRPQSSGGAIYDGPNELSEWKPQNGDRTDWVYSEGALIYNDSNNETIGLELPDLPDMARIRMKMSWKGNLQVYLMFWASNVENTSDLYTITMQHSYIRCRRSIEDHGRNDLGHVQFPNLQRLNNAYVELLLNREEKEIYLLVNDELVKKWTDNFDGDIKGNGFMVRPTSNTPIKLEQVRVSTWDGQLKAAQEDEQLAGTQDTVEMSNGDVFSGSMVSIEGNLMKFKTDFAELKIPVDRIGEFRLSADGRGEPRRMKGDVQVWLPNDARVTLDLASWEKGVLQGSSEATGPLKVRAAYVTRLEFNPYDERREGVEESW